MTARNGWLARHAVGCFYLTLYTALLAAAEYLVITRFLLNAPSTQLDWIMATAFFAPIMTVAAVLTIMIIGWLACLMIPRR